MCPAWASSPGRSRSEIARLQETIFESVGHQFNLGSPKQLEQVLFYELDLPRGKRTKTGYSTDASVLEELRAAHPMIPALLDWRLYTKLKSTYIDALPLLLDPSHASAAHHLPAGGGGDRAAVVGRPEPPEHPHPDRAGPQDPARVRVR